MGQKPDPAYNPESRDQRCYYSREERLALPNAPKPVKRNRTRIFIIIILDVLLLFFAWQCILDLRRDAGRQRAESEVVLDRYHYKAVFEKASRGFEIKFLVRQTNDAAFVMPTNALARFALDEASGTNAVTIPADGVELPRPLHIFRAGFPAAGGSGRVVVRYSAGGHPPAVVLEFKR